MHMKMKSSNSIELQYGGTYNRRELDHNDRINYII
jgi:hypothetical protein